MHVSVKFVNAQLLEGIIGENLKCFGPCPCTPSRALPDQHAHFGPAVTRVDVPQPNIADVFAARQLERKPNGVRIADDGELEEVFVLRLAHREDAIEQSGDFRVVDPNPPMLEIGSLQGPQGNSLPFKPHLDCALTSRKAESPPKLLLDVEASNPESRRTVAVLQPSYLPWLGAFEQMARADVFVFYDDVQYDKNGWRNRNRIRTHGEPGWSWLTLPVKLPHAFAPLGEVNVDPRAPWGRKHRRALELAYASAPYRSELERFTPLFEMQTTSLVEIAIASTQAIAGALGLVPTFLRSSELGIGGDRNLRLLEICKALGATDYYSGKAAEEYLDVGIFAEAGIHVAFQEFVHPEYEQCHKPFISHLSTLDALLCIGPARTRALVETQVAA